LLAACRQIERDRRNHYQEVLIQLNSYRALITADDPDTAAEILRLLVTLMSGSAISSSA
jgi:hypothetical protein